jgi:hypothetical protein
MMCHFLSILILAAVGRLLHALACGRDRLTLLLKQEMFGSGSVIVYAAGSVWARIGRHWSFRVQFSPQ